MKVTKITAQTHDHNRISVFVDGQFLTGADRLYIVQQGIGVGTELSSAEAQRLVQADTYHKAYQQALRLLSLRPQSQAEMSQKLSRRWNKPVVQQATDRLRREGWLDDDRFAEAWVQERARTRSRSLSHLRAELVHKGIARSIIDRVLSHPQLVDDQLDIARQLAQKYLNRSGVDIPKARAYLARRGYQYAIIEAALKDIPIS